MGATSLKIEGLETQIKFRPGENILRWESLIECEERLTTKF